MTRVVSVTPTAIERDSRTFKHAASLAPVRLRLGRSRGPAEPDARHRDALRAGHRRPGPPAAAPARGATAARASAQWSAGRGRPDEGRGDALSPRPRQRGSPRAGSPNLCESCSTAMLRALIPRSAVARYVRRNARVYRALPPAELYYLHSYAQFVPVYLRSLRQPGRATSTTPTTPTSRSIPRSPKLFRRLTPRLRPPGALLRQAGRRFTTVSDGVADLLENRFGRRPEVVRNCPDLRLDTEAPAGIREVLGIPADAFLLVSVGNAKTGMTVEEDCRPWPSCRKRPPRLRRRRPGALRREGLRARPGGPRPPAAAGAPTEVTSFIRGADAAALLYYAVTPNFLNALPNRFFHAVAAGLPQLYPPLTEVSALADRFGLGIQIDPQDPASIALATRSLIEDPERLAAYREGAAHAREQLNWEREEEAAGPLVRACIGDGRCGVRHRGSSVAARGRAGHPEGDGRLDRPPGPRRRGLPDALAGGRVADDALARGARRRAGHDRLRAPAARDHRPERRAATSRCSTQRASWRSLYNGEIYNYRRAARRARGARARVPDRRRHRGRCSRAYREWGDGLRRAAGRACGRSRSSIRRARPLLLARDRFGIKPLYYCVGTATAPLRLRDQGAARRRRRAASSPIEAVVRRFLLSGAVDDSDATFFAASAVPPAHAAPCRSTRRPRMRVRRYWSPPPGRFDGSLADAAGCFAELFADAVGIHAAQRRAGRDLPERRPRLVLDRRACGPAARRAARSQLRAPRRSATCRGDEPQSERRYMRAVVDAHGPRDDLRRASLEHFSRTRCSRSRGSRTSRSARPASPPSGSSSTRRARAGSR